MPSQEPYQTAEAVRRVLPELWSWTDTSAALPRAETEPFSTLLASQILQQSIVVPLQNEAKFSKWSNGLAIGAERIPTRPSE
jgi:hypothetical protein